jgi:NitT/TauT family transport system substrate-binding protein
VVVDDRAHVETSCSVYAFRREIVNERPNAVAGFLAAIAEASEAINDNKGRWSDLLGEKELVPRPLMGSYQLPDYPGDEAPSESQFADAVDWLQETGRLTQGPAYADSVDSSFLP